MKTINPLDTRQMDIKLDKLIDMIPFIVDEETLKFVVKEIGFIFYEESDIAAENILLELINHDNREIQLIAFSFLSLGKASEDAKLTLKRFESDSQNFPFVAFLKNRTSVVGCH